MIEHSDFYRISAALAIGFLIGLQREYAYGDPDKEMFAGVRTFALMGMIGALAALASDALASPWPFVVVMLFLGGFLISAYSISAWRGDMGLTSEMAALAAILAGALCYWNYLPLAAAVGVGTTVLLSLKIEMRSFVQRITREDVYASLKFAVITAIVLPILPNETFGPAPFNVLNPYKIWLMVVLISGISFFGYVAIKVVGPEQGIGLAGLLGGLVSSTAVTLSFTQRSRRETGLAKPFAVAIFVAWTVMFARVIVEVGALNAALLRMLWMPLGASAGVGLIYCGYLYIAQHGAPKEEMGFSNPFELGPAIKFGLVYAAILLFSTAAQTYLGNTGVYISSVASGLADVDAIALSLSGLSNAGNIEMDIAARAIVMAAMSNTIAKGAIVLMGGSRAMRRALLPGLLLMLATGVGGALMI